jgi:NAD-dependent dihydropyrimidine dehydrogenase PreA subunit
MNANHIIQTIMRVESVNGPSLDTLLNQFDQELENIKSLEKPGPESNPRTPFDGPEGPGARMSISGISPGQALSLLPIMIPLRRQMGRSAKLYDGRFQPARNRADATFIRELEQRAYRAGARDIKYVEVPPDAIFQNKGIPHKYAIIFTVEMDKGNLEDAPSFEAFKEVAKGYRNLALVGNKLAKFMRDHGYAAYPGTALGGLSDYVYLAELAGLGVVGYHGLLISPKEGACQRINTIYTNISNLPISTDNDHLWVRDFCAMCRKCIRECPVDAIFDQPISRGDGGYQTINRPVCRKYFNQHYGCGICLITCPFSRHGYQKIKGSFKGNPDAPKIRLGS